MQTLFRMLCAIANISNILRIIERVCGSGQVIGGSVRKIEDIRGILES